MTGQRPSIGRVVHYVSHRSPLRADGSQAYESECRAAVIAGIPDIGGPYTALETLEGLPSDLVSLVVLNPSGLFFNDAEHDEDEHRGGSWHWPEREEAAVQAGQPRRLDSSFGVRLSYEQVLEVAQAANACGVTLSAYLRQAGLALAAAQRAGGTARCAHVSAAPVQALECGICGPLPVDLAVRVPGGVP